MMLRNKIQSLESNSIFFFGSLCTLVIFWLCFDFKNLEFFRVFFFWYYVCEIFLLFCFLLFLMINIVSEYLCGSREFFQCTVNVLYATITITMDSGSWIPSNSEANLIFFLLNFLTCFVMYNILMFECSSLYYIIIIVVVVVFFDFS